MSQQYLMGHRNRSTDNMTTASETGGSRSSRARSRSGCGFCKKNGETEEFYLSHKLRDENNNVTCPVLLEYRCAVCGAKGRHTVSYCPKRKKNSPAIGKDGLKGDAKDRALLAELQPTVPTPTPANQNASNSQVEHTLLNGLANLHLMDRETQNRELLKRTMLEILREIVLAIQVMNGLIVKHV